MICCSGVFRIKSCELPVVFGWLPAKMSISHSIICLPTNQCKSIIASCAAIMYSYDWHWHFIWWSNSQEWFSSLWFWGYAPYILPGQSGLAQNKYAIFIEFVDQGKAHSVYCQRSRGSCAGQMYHMSGRAQIPCLITQTSCRNLRLQDTSTQFGLRSRGTRGEKYLLVSILLPSKC